METINSRQNKYIRRLKALSTDRAYRALHGEYICDGEKLLEEAIRCGAEITSALYCGDEPVGLPPEVRRYRASRELLKYASPLRETAGPLFTVRIPPGQLSVKPGQFSGELERVLILDRVQDPGNVGTIIRTASAFRIDAVILTKGCADPYNPKTVRSAMGALFRQRIVEMEVSEIAAILKEAGLPLYGAALSEMSADIREVDIRRAAVAIGSEGQGLSDELLGFCDRLLIIPMGNDTQSLNAAVSAAVIMWEMAKQHF